MSEWLKHEKIHPACALFPMLPDAELAALTESIRTSGLRLPIVRDRDGQIIDGRNRLVACERAGVNPDFVLYTGDDPRGEVVRLNMLRRHLNESQRAMVAARMAKLIGGQRKTGKSADVPTQAEAAELLAVSERSVRSARKVQQECDEETIAKVDAGEISVHAALGGDEKPRKKRKSNQARRTPKWFFNVLADYFGPFDLDAYASHDDALCRDYLTTEENGHVHQWKGKTFANPPFLQMQPVLEQAWRQCSNGVQACILAPAGGSQDWLHEIAIRGVIWLPDCRINFDDENGRPTGPHNDEPGSDRDTIVVTMGGELWNHPDRVKAGYFDVRRLEVKYLRPETRS